MTHRGVAVRSLFLAALLTVPVCFFLDGYESSSDKVWHLLSYYCGCLLIVFVLLIPYYIQRWNKWSARILDLLIHVCVWLISISSVFLAVTYHTTFNITILQVLLETNIEESSEFATTFLLQPSVIGLFIAYVSFFVVEYTIVHKIAVQETGTDCFGKKSVIWYTLLAVLLLSQVNLRHYFSSSSESNTSHLRLDRSLHQYGPVCMLYNTYLQYDASKNDLEKCELSCIEAVVDSCSFKSSNIVLVIGESHNRHHSSLYGYEQNTNPCLSALSDLQVFDNVVTPFNFTTLAFRSFMSMASADRPELSWYDTPLFPVFFKKAGYNVVFYSNEFARMGNNDPWVAQVGFIFQPSITGQMFEVQNDYLYPYDGEMIDDYIAKRDSLEKKDHNFIIFHLIGQHINPAERYPEDFNHFGKEHVDRPNLSEEEKQQVANYDNATLYNDYVIAKIIELYKNEDAIVIYFSDHGDEANDYCSRVGRVYDYSNATSDCFHCQFDVPFLVYMTEKYRESHPDIYARVDTILHEPFMTDDLPHLLLGLGGIGCRWYDATRDFFSESYIASRKRLVAETIDYDSATMHENTFYPYYGK